MSDSFQENAPGNARAQLAKACRTKDKSLRLALTITAGEVLLLGVFVVALADYWLMLPVWMRSTAAAGLALLGLAALARLVRFLRRPTPLKEAALDVEAAQPGLGCEVSTAAEYLSGERRTTHEYEPQLVAALEAKAAEHLSQTTVPYQKRLRTPAAVLAVTGLILLGFILATPAGWRAVTRAILPFAKVQYTQLVVEPGDIEVQVGHDLEITNRFAGRPPKDAQIQWRPETESAWQTSLLTSRGSDGSYLYLLKDVRTNMAYQVMGSDAVSPVFHVTAYSPPEVKELTVSVEYPAYTKLPPTSQKSADLSVLRASTVRVQVEPTVPLSAARLHFSGSGELAPLQPDPSGVWSGAINVTKDTDYWIELVDLKGRLGRQEAAHHIKALPDLPPKIDIEDPAQDMRAAATNTVPVKMSIGDDFGVEKVELVFHKLGGSEQVLEARVQPGADGRLSAEAELDLSKLELSEFELVAYHARATDNNHLDGPGKGESPVYFIEVTNLEGGSSPPRNPGQKLNLLAIQKQIIADTAPLPTTAAADQFNTLAQRQRDAAAFAEIYRSTLAGSGALPEAISEFEAAVAQMQTASAQLEQQQKSPALAAEEGALAHLYQVIKHMPELKDLPTQPPPQNQAPPKTNQLAVVLEAIKEKRQEQPETQALTEALEQAQQLAQAQAELNALLRKLPSSSNPPEAQPTPPSPAQANGQGEGQALDGPDSDAAEDKQPSEKLDAGAKPKQLASAKSAPPSKAPADKGKGKGKGKAQAKAKSKAKSPAQAQGQGHGQGKGKGKAEGAKPGEPDEGSPEANDIAEQPAADSPEDPEVLAHQEEQIGKKATELAEKLARLAGKDKRLGHKAGQNANVAGHKIATAAEQLKKGNFGAAGVNGYQGEAALQSVVTELQRVAGKPLEWTDVANEEAPKAYEPVISEYFKRLSHAE